MIRHFLKDSKGATAIEYGLIASLICVVIIVSFVSLGSSLEATFEYVTGEATPALS